MAKKKVEALPLSLEQKCLMVEPDSSLAIMHQCSLIHLPKGTYYRRIELRNQCSERNRARRDRAQQSQGFKEEII